MSIKVSGVNNVYFKGSSNTTADFGVSKPDKQIKELGYVTPDFDVKVPVKYTKVSEDNLPNGLKLHSYKLSNGYKVSIVPMEDSPAVVKTYVNVGAMNETPDIKGISHFLEHMAFNGTNGEDGHIKLETGDSFKKIDELGGWANATTNYALTDYINQAPLLDKNDVETQIKVLAAMAEDLKLSDEMIKKEKGPVSSEINMIMDSPETIAMDQTVRTLYNIKSPADDLVGGSVRHIQNLTRKDVMDYYKKYYYPENTNIVITGDVNPDEVIKAVAKNFVSKCKKTSERYEEKLTPIEKTVRKDFVSDKTKSTEMILGFNGVKNNSVKESEILNIAINYLQSEGVALNKKIKDLNGTCYISTERISTKPDGNEILYIASTSSDENSEKVLKTIFNTIGNVKPISDEELERIKSSIKELRKESFEYSSSVNNIVGNAVLNNVTESLLNYESIIDGITKEDVDSAIKKYFDLNKTAITVVHPEEKNQVAFKGNTRKPVDESKITKTVLDNNIELGFYTANSDKRVMNASLTTDVPYNKKAGVREVLSAIYDMGTSNIDEDSFNLLKECLNADIFASAGTSGLSVSVSVNKNKLAECVDVAKDLIYNPRITPETLKKAKEKIRDNITHMQNNAGDVYYNEFYSKYNQYVFSDQEILDNLDSITLEDVKDCHNYILQNSRGTVSVNTQKNDTSGSDKIVTDFAKSLNPVMENKPQFNKIYKRVAKPVVLTGAENNSQADIKLVYNFKYEDTLKNKALLNVMNSILTSSSIGLFDVLREKEHLAYSVYSDVNRTGDLGEVSLNISTTTDNKDTGEQSFDNIQKSINGFKRQIGQLVNGEFTADDLENAKRAYKAKLLDREGIGAKVGILDSGLNSKYGISGKNELYDQIDGITKDDITNFAKMVFSVNPVYSVTATQDTLDANKEFLENLKN